MEESKELKNLYTFLQGFVYLLLILELLLYVHISLGRIDVILLKIGKLAIYKNIFYCKLFTMFLLMVVCIGTKAKKNLELDPLKHIALPLFFGFILFFGSAFFNLSDYNYMIDKIRLVDIIYIFFAFVGLILMHIGLDNISKKIKSNMMKDRFNVENESFEQTSEKIETPYSVNIPMSYYYQKKRHKGWINIINPFRGTLVLGVPGSGKSFCIVNPYIKQLSDKGFSMVVYDYKFPDLSKIAYYYFLKNKSKGVLPVNAQFNVVNFNDVEHSVRINPLKPEYIKSLADAIETAEALIESLKRGTAEGGNDKFFTQSAINFLASIIFFFTKYENGKYSDLPHVLAFINLHYSEIFNVLYTEPELNSLLSPFRTAFDNKAFEQLEGQIGTLKVQISRLATKESFWVFTEDENNPVNLKVSDNDNPSYLMIANSPETQNINSALNALVLNRLVRLVNSKGNRPCAIVVDELPTVFFHGLANLLATARSNKVAVLLALQELPQLKEQYGDKAANVILSVCANMFSGAAKDKHTLDWLEKLFGKIKQVKENISINQDKTSISFNESMDYLIPASKIAGLQTGQLVGQVAVDAGLEDKIKVAFYNCKADLNIKQIENEQEKYIDCKKVYNFGSDEKKNDILRAYYFKINDEINQMIANF